MSTKNSRILVLVLVDEKNTAGVSWFSECFHCKQATLPSVTPKRSMDVNFALSSPMYARTRLPTATVGDNVVACTIVRRSVKPCCHTQPPSSFTVSPTTTQSQLSKPSTITCSLKYVDFVCFALRGFWQRSFVHNFRTLEFHRVQCSNGHSVWLTVWSVLEH